MPQLNIQHLTQQEAAALYEAYQSQQKAQELAAKHKAAQEEAARKSAQELNKGLAAAVAKGIEQGNLNHMQSKALLERGGNYDQALCLLTQKVLSTPLFGVSRVDKGYWFKEAFYPGVKPLATAVEEYIGVRSVPLFIELLSAVISGKTLSFDQVRSLLEPTKETYNKDLLTADDAALAVAFNI